MIKESDDLNLDIASRSRVNSIESIDFLRGLAILFVILLHLNVVMPLSQFIPAQFSKIIFFSGYYGVIIFFVISGFLITNSSILRWGELGNIDIFHFYRMRAARILPSLLLIITILSMLHLTDVKGFIIDDNKTSLGKTIFSALIFNLNYLESQVGYLPGSWDVLWSLSVEEVFYFIFPLCCIITRKKQWLILALTIMVISGPFARISIHSNDIWQDRSYLSCMDGIALGCMAAFLTHRYQPKKFVVTLIFYFAVSFFSFVFFFRTTVFRLGLTDIGINVSLLELSVAVLLMAFKWNNFRISNVAGECLLNMGRNSYEIYITHMFIVIGVASLPVSKTPLRCLLWYFVVILASAVCGQLLAKYFSIPLNRYFRGKR